MAAANWRRGCRHKPKVNLNADQITSGGDQASRVDPPAGPAATQQKYFKNICALGTRRSDMIRAH